MNLHYSSPNSSEVWQFPAGDDGHRLHLPQGSEGRHLAALLDALQGEMDTAPNQDNFSLVEFKPLEG